MKNLITIYRRECYSYFNSPIAYILIVAFLLAMALIFFTFLRFFSNPSPDFRAYFENIIPFSFFSFVFIPAVTMRLWAEEKKEKTVELLLTLPLKSWEVVASKFLAGYTVVAIMVLLTLSVPLSISWVLDLDQGAVTASYIGILLIGGVYIALGSFISALTENQIVAFILTVVLSAIVCFMSYPPFIEWVDQNVIDGLGSLFGYFGTFFHFQNFARGLINPVDLLYVFSMMGLFLILNNFAVESRKF